MNWFESVAVGVSIFMGVVIVATVVFALTSNWINYVWSQRFYMFAGVMIGATAVQRGIRLYHLDMQPSVVFWLSMVTLTLILIGAAFGKDKRLREKPWEQALKEQATTEEYEVYERIIRLTRESNKLLEEDTEWKPLT